MAVPPSESEERLLEIAFTLLDRLDQWRLRAVERIELSDHRWSIRSKRIHVKALTQARIPGLMERLQTVAKEDVDGVKRATIILPLSQITKNAVVDFHATVDGRDVFRVSRLEGARLQARYITRLARTHGLPVDPGLEEIMAAVVGSTYPSAPNRREKWEKRKKRFTSLSPEEAEKRRLEEYIKERLELTDIGEVRKAATLRAKVVREIRQHALRKRESAAENPLLALPYLNQLRVARNEQPLDAEGLIQQLDVLKSFLDAAASHPGIMRLYAEYGRNWEALSRCRVPIDRPFIITVSVKRHIQFESPTGERKWRERRVAWSHVRFSDAESNHVNIRVPDVNVEFSEHACEATDVLNKEPRLPPDHEHKTSELFAVYSSKKNRSPYLWIKTPLRLARPTELIHGVVLATILATWGFIAVAYLCDHRWLTAQQLALLLTPSTFAAALLLVREATPLTAKITAGTRTFILLSLMFLWGSMLFLFAKEQLHVSEGPGPKSPSTPTVHVTVPTPTIIVPTPTVTVRLATPS